MAFAMACRKAPLPIYEPVLVERTDVTSAVPRTIATSPAREVNGNGPGKKAVGNDDTDRAAALITSDVNGHLGGVKCPGGLELDKQTPIA
jgi:hypothetical protein